MYIKFEYIKFKNLNSYGNNYTYFNFEEGFNLISGKNGEGKSSIIDALCFVLFGTPYRKININKLINRQNKKNLVVNTKFIINKDVFEITRGIKPDILEIKKNDLKLDLLHSKKLIQEEIEKIININLVLFKNIISLSINYNKPFLSLGQPDKRDIIENIFNIKIFGIIVKTLKTSNTSLKSDFKINKSTLEYLAENLKSLKNKLGNLEKEKQNYLKQKNDELLHILNQYRNTVLKIKNNNKKCISIEESIKSENTKLISKHEDIGKINDKIVKFNFELKNLKKDKLFFDNNDTCSICKNSITQDHKDKHLKDIEKRILYIDNQLKSSTKIFNNTKKIVDENLLIQRSIDKYKVDMKLLNNDVSIYKDELKRIKSNFKNKKKQNINLNLDELNREFKLKKDEYKKLHSTTKLIKEEIDINKCIFDILSEEGIKSYFLSKLIPILNKKINDYLNQFELPIQIEFNKLMEENIKSITRNEPIDYMSFSEGEKKRIDISILLSFLDMTKIISNFSTNILFFDELLDSSTDENGLEKTIKMIKHSLKKDTCAYVITHRNNDYEFDNIYRVEKNDSFSTIIKE